MISRRAGEAPSGGALATRLRLASGLVLMAFVSTHLLNHALGLHSLGAMQDGRSLFLAVWRSGVGTALLYGALTLHVLLTLFHVWSLRTLRLPAWQIAQVALGLAIPLLLIGHVFGTRIAHEMLGVGDDYVQVLRVLWPELAVRQTVLVLLVWLHGVVGLHYWLRLRPGYRRVRPLLAGLALLLPLLALLGFALAGREVEMLDRSGYGALAERAEPVAAPAVAQARFETLWTAANVLFAGMILVALSGPVARQLRARRSDFLSVRYPDGSVVPIDPGMSILEASRTAGIPHAAVCGGRGRCSTCRVRITAGAADLPPPAPDEARVLKRIGATEDVRLACQLRPVRPVAVIPLLSPGAGPRDALTPLDPAQGVEREIAIMFADLRAFTRLAEGRLPYDVVFVLNQYFGAVGRAIEAEGGRVDKFIGDGVMALFGTGSSPEEACRSALRAARGTAIALADLNRRLAQDLPEPLRIAIGLHAGPVILGSMGYGDAISLTAIGDAVNVASRLESMAKELDVQLVVSAAVAARAGVDLEATERRELVIRGRRRALEVRLVEDATRLPAAPAGAAVPDPAAAGWLARLWPNRAGPLRRGGSA